MRIRGVLLVGVVCAAYAAPAAGQAWDAPSFFSPLRMDDVGFYLADPEGADLGFQGIWRQSGNLNLGLRAGLAGPEHDRGALVGAEFYGPLYSASDSPLVLAWVVGLGATFRDASYLRIPAGISLGAVLGQPGGVTVVPYVYPRVALDIVTIESGDVEHTDTDLRVPVDLGADLNLGPSFILRFGITFDTRDAVGLGLAYRIPRNLSVR